KSAAGSWHSGRPGAVGTEAVRQTRPLERGRNDDRARVGAERLREVRDARGAGVAMRGPASWIAERLIPDEHCGRTRPARRAVPRRTLEELAGPADPEC